MALTYLQTQISHPQNHKKVSRRMLVDSGATYSVVPASILKKLNIKPIDKQTFILANGEAVEKQIGEARLTIKDKQRTVPVVFGDEGVWLLGATTLENMGLILDPINRKLKALPMTL
jgi:clan AA aspartic protease